MPFQTRIAQLQQRFPGLSITLASPDATAARVTYHNAGCQIEGWLYDTGACRFELVAINSADCAEQLLDLIHAIQG